MPVAARAAQTGFEYAVPLCQRRDGLKRFQLAPSGRQIQVSVQIHLLRHVPEQIFYGRYADRPQHLLPLRSCRRDKGAHQCSSFVNASYSSALRSSEKSVMRSIFMIHAS